MQTYALPSLVTLGVLILMFVNAANVGRQRGRYKIGPPHTGGHPMLERAFRVQMNTLENAVLALPAMWLFALYVSIPWAAGFGALWLALRVWYAVAYMADPAKRLPAFGGSMLVIAVLILGGLAGAGRAMLLG